MPAKPILLDAATDLATTTSSQRFDGGRHGDGVELSFFLNHTAPGREVAQHRHPYAEVFVVQDGEAVFSVDGETLAARAGHVVVVPPGAAHGFRNTGASTLEMVSLHPAAEMVTEWLEDG
jgi:quercetin dioxygenase-like cupin family protein